MKVFLSWSGELSNELAEVFRRWLPSVIQTIQPYFTPDDIGKGARWSSEIVTELEASQFGLLFMTVDSLGSTWMAFEAGSLAKSVTASRVCPILFNLKPTDIEGPIAQFQAIEFEEKTVKRLLHEMNERLGESALGGDVFEKVWHKWWPDLVGEINAVLSKERRASRQVRSEVDMLEEILALVRRPRAAIKSVDVLPMLIQALEEYASQVNNGSQIVEADISFVKGVIDYVEQVAQAISVSSRLSGRLHAVLLTWNAILNPPVEDEFDPFADE